MQTLDADQPPRLKKTSPAFHRLLVAYANERGRLNLSRRRLFKRLEGPRLLPEILDLWKQHANSLAPDPARNHKSRYGHHAGWMGAIRELSFEAYADIIDDWSVAHRRRRNLWKALEDSDLPTGEELGRERAARRKPTTRTRRRKKTSPGRGKRS